MVARRGGRQKQSASLKVGKVAMWQENEDRKATGSRAASTHSEVYKSVVALVCHALA